VGRDEVHARSSWPPQIAGRAIYEVGLIERFCETPTKRIDGGLAREVGSMASTVVGVTCAA
jgi:hypothetical protein